MGCPDSSESYKHAKKLQRRDVRELLEKFGRVLNWRSDGEDTVLDISCGSGDLTIDYILPILPKSFKRLVGTDPSEELIQQAQQQNGHPKVFFEQFDVGIDMQKQQLQYIQPADHIMSLHSLHWEQNHEQAVRNIYNLLKPNGDCLLLFVANSPVYEAWDQISQTKWGRYMTNSNPFMGMYQDSFDPADEFAQLFRLCDFSQYHVEVCEKTVTFGDSDCLKSFLKEIDPFYGQIPSANRDAYLDDLTKLLMKLSYSSLKYIYSVTNTTVIQIPYKSIIAYARK